MIIEFRALYFKVDEEPFVNLEHASKLFNVDFVGDNFPEQGIHANDLIRFLEQGGWKVNIVQPDRDETYIKVFLTQKRIEEDDY